MDPALSAGLVAEVLDDVGDVGVIGREPGALHALAEHRAGWPDERMALDVLAVSGLLADEHHACVRVALAHHRLRGTLPEVARPAFLYGRPHVCRAGLCGHW